MAGRQYGLARDKRDYRDFRRFFGNEHVKAAKDTPVVDLSKYISHRYDQGDLESYSKCSLQCIWNGAQETRRK